MNEDRTFYIINVQTFDCSIANVLVSDAIPIQSCQTRQSVHTPLSLVKLYRCRMSPWPWHEQQYTFLKTFLHSSQPLRTAVIAWRMGVCFIPYLYTLSWNFSEESLHLNNTYLRR